MIDAGPAAREHATASHENAAGSPARALERLRATCAHAWQLAASLGAQWVQNGLASARSLVQPRLLRQAIAASRRGNLDAAFALLREEVHARPDEPKSTLLFWGVALACERAPEAAEPMARLVRNQAAAGQVAEAVDQWLALVAEVPGAVLDVATLARIVPVLRTRYSEARGKAAQQQGRERLIDALRRSVDPASGALTVGIALRLVEEARGLDVDVARRAAVAALASPGLHEAKRVRLNDLVRSLEGGRWPEAPAALPPPAPVAPKPAPAASTPRPTAAAPAARPAPAARAPQATPAAPTPPVQQAAPDPSPLSVDARPEPPVPAERRPAPPILATPSQSAFRAVASAGALRSVEITPVELAEDGLVAWEVGGEQRTRVHYRAIEAIAAAEVAGLAEAGVIVIDLVLRTTRPGRPRSSLRMRSDRFDPTTLFPERTDAGQALRALLSELLDRSGAVPLPDPDSALALRPQRFESLAAFEAATVARLSS